MVLGFLLLFRRFNLLSLSLKKRQKVVEKSAHSHIEVVEIFEYEKNNDKYWNGAKLYQQLVNKALSITETLYLIYLLLFLVDNTTNYFSRQ